MVKKHLKELTIVIGLIVALLLANYICLTPKPTKAVDVAHLSVRAKTNYIPMFTELFVLSTKLILKPLN